MNILIADKFQDSAVEALRQAGCNVEYDGSLDGDALKEAVIKTECAVLVVRSTKVTEDILAASGKLNVVVRAGAGVNTIDTKAASLRSVLVANCPGKNSVAVAELTFGLILALDRRIVDNVRDLSDGTWNKKEYSKARGLKGRTLGVVGLGKIGEAVVKRAKAFEMNVAVWSRSFTPQRAKELDVIFCDSPADVASRSDIFSIHLAAAAETKNIINADVLNRLAPGSYVINTARADVVDYKALEMIMKEKGLRVGLDVYPDEPKAGDKDFKNKALIAGGGVYGTHHIGASTDQAQDAIAQETVRIVNHYMKTGQVENCVNLCAKSPARYVVVVRHRNQPGVLAHALGAIRHAGINVEEMENVICDGAESACAQIKVDSPLPDEVLKLIETGHEHVIGVSEFAVGD